jgi:hypothetical protein
VQARALADHGGGLESVHLGHHHVKQNKGKLLLQQALQGFAPGPGQDQVFIQPGKDRLEGKQLAWLVIDQKYVDFVHGLVE